jgi:hypothetical protein
MNFFEGLKPGELAALKAHAKLTVDRAPRLYTVEDAKLGGPGLDGYAYRADVYCVDCGREITTRVFKETPAMTWTEFNDSERCPQPIFFGEGVDCAYHCGVCGRYLYGRED